MPTRLSSCFRRMNSMRDCVCLKIVDLVHGVQVQVCDDALVMVWPVLDCRVCMYGKSQTHRCYLCRKF